MTTTYLIKRNIKMFFKDKGLVLSSLITPLILILLYVTFLKNVYVDSFNSALEQVNMTIDEKYINALKIIVKYDTIIMEWYEYEKINSNISTFFNGLNNDKLQEKPIRRIIW